MTLPLAARRRKAPDLREFRLHCVIADILRLKADKRLLWFHPANGESRSVKTGAKLKRMGVLPGTADFALTLPDGRSAFLEVKAGDGRLSFNQELFQAACEQRGIPYAVVRSSFEAERVLADWGALRGPVSASVRRAA